MDQHSLLGQAHAGVMKPPGCFLPRGIIRSWSTEFGHTTVEGSPQPLHPGVVGPRQRHVPFGFGQGPVSQPGLQHRRRDSP